MKKRIGFVSNSSNTSFIVTVTNNSDREMTIRDWFTDHKDDILKELLDLENLSERFEKYGSELGDIKGAYSNSFSIVLDKANRIVSEDRTISPFSSVTIKVTNRDGAVTTSSLRSNSKEFDDGSSVIVSQEHHI